MIVFRLFYWKIYLYYTTPTKSAGNWFYCKWVASDFEVIGYRILGICILFEFME